MAMLTLMLTRC